MNFAKKAVAVALSVTMALSLTGCLTGGGGKPAAKDSKGTKWPTKPITLVVPWSAGGDTDFFTRTLGKYLSKELGQTVNVVNTTGGGGSVASNKIKDSKPDGTTFLCFDTAMALNHASGIANFGYEAFNPVCMMAKSTGEYLVVRKDFPANTVAELIKYTQEHPGEVKLAANTGATSYYVAVRLHELGAKFNIVNSGSSSERIASLLGNHIDASVNAMGVLAQYLPGTGNGQLKILACLANERSEKFKDIPLAKDQKVDLAYDMTYNILAPKGTDPKIIETLSKACGKVIKENPEYAQEIWKAYGSKPFYQDTKDAVQTLKAEDEKYMKYADVFKKGLK